MEHPRFNGKEWVARDISKAAIRFRKNMKTLNIIFNQLGFIVVLSAAALVYFNIIALSVDFFVILTIIWLAILILSETIYANLQRYSK